MFFICLFWGIQIHSSSAQEFDNNANLSKHTYGYALGYAYPKFARGGNYASVKSAFNYGISASWEWGKHYTSGISFMIAPGIYFSDFNDTEILYYQQRNVNGNRIVSSRDSIQFTELEIQLPVSYEFPLFKPIRLGVGAYASFPLMTTGHEKRVSNTWWDYEADIEYEFEPRLGVSGRLLCQIHRSTSVESFLSFDYAYDVSFTTEVNAHKSKFSISYVYRKVKYKDVRTKWDSYLIKKYKNKNV